LRTENGQLFFQSDFNHNTDNIFSLDPATGKTLQLTQARFGAFDPFPGQNALQTRLYYSDYTATGYQLTEISVDSLLNTQADLTARQTAVLPVNRTPRFIVDTLRVPEELSYPVKKYNKVLHAARVHSWLPFYFNFNELESFSFQKYHETVSAGVTLMSQNSLGTLYSILGYSYHNRFHSGHFHVNYSGLLPVFSLEVNVNDRFRTQNYTRQENNKIVFVTDTIRAPLLEARLYSYIPFTFNSHGWQRGFIPSIQYRFTNDSYYVREKQRYINKGMLQAGIRYYQVQNRAERDIFPRLGMGLNLQWDIRPGRSLFLAPLDWFGLRVHSRALPQPGIKDRCRLPETTGNRPVFLSGIFPVISPRNEGTGLRSTYFQADCRLCHTNMAGRSVGTRGAVPETDTADTLFRSYVCQGSGRYGVPFSFLWHRSGV
jgi:hypothetical protein